MTIVRDAWPIAGVCALAALALGGWAHPLAALPPLVLALFTLWFFRDPERHPPSDPGALLSPADGRIIRTGPDRVSVFMNVFDVHVCRSPTAGRVAAAEHRPGRFMAAWRDEASDQNERLRIEVEQGPRRVAFTLVAGLVARRIVARVTPGERLVAGQRVGWIRFGSRVDLELPPGGSVAVRIGDRVVAGETVLARFPVEAAATDATPVAAADGAPVPGTLN